jgi:hypothetical protein
MSNPTTLKKRLMVVLLSPFLIIFMLVLVYRLKNHVGKL